MKFLSIATAVAILFVSVEAVKVNPLPKPQWQQWGNGSAIYLSSNFRIVAYNPNPALASAIIRTERQIHLGWEPQTWEAPLPKYPAYPGPDGPGGPGGAPAPNKRSAPLNEITIRVDDSNADLQHGVDESYTIGINSSGGVITAKTTWGAIRALSTLEQIVITNPSGSGLIIEASVLIHDKPNYPHRGLLLDTGRNFYPVKDILRIIDALGFAKLNVLHWHIDDSQSWPLQLNVYPEMTKDAYSNKEVYTHKDVKTIIKYGRERGVRVIPELDMPGHASAGWKRVDPNIVTCDNSWWDNDGWTYHSAVEPTPGQLDVIYPKTYEVIKNIYDEVADLFADNLYHGGFDEVQTYCFNYSKPISDWFKADPSRTYSDLTQHFLNKTYPILTSKKERVIYWEDVLLNGGTPTAPGVGHANTVPKNAILQSWNNGLTNIDYLTGLGYDVIVSSSDFFYLDCGFGGWVTNDNRYDQDTNDGAVISGINITIFGAASAGGFNYGGSGGSWCAPYKTWQRIYEYDFTANLTAAQKSHVLGGELAMWSEQSDSTVVDGKVFPRAAAFAESLWSGNRDSTGHKRYREATARVLEFRERLVARGVNASPLMPKWCLKNPHQCDFNIAQYVTGF